MNNNGSIFIVETPSDLASATFRGSHIVTRKQCVITTGVIFYFSDTLTNSFRTV